MSLTFDSRRLGDVVVVTLDGRLVLGETIAAFEKYLDELIVVNPHILLDLSEVSFIDSAALGKLVTYVTRAGNASGTLRICAVSPTVDRVLSVSRLKPVLQPFDSEGRAIDDARTGRDTFAAPDVLCVDESEDVLAYVRELLRRNGHRAMTASNLPDAVILLSAMRPRVVVVGASLSAASGTRSADEFRRLSAACARVELPPGFAHQEAGAASEQVLAWIRELVQKTD
jgi:anti-anti-sigma factor